MVYTPSEALLLLIIGIVKKNQRPGTSGRFQHISFALQGHKLVTGSIHGSTLAGCRHVTRSRDYGASSHSEMNSSKSVAYSKKRAKTTIVVVRCRKKDDNIELLMSRPCIRCVNMMLQLGIQWVIYSIPDGVRRCRPRDLIHSVIPSSADRIMRKTLFVKSPAYQRIAMRQKNIELRLPRKFIQGLSIGNTINISNGAGEVFVAKIINIRKYSAIGSSAAPTLRHILRKEGLSRTLPQVNSLEHGVRYLLHGDDNSSPVFRWDKVIKLGVWAFELELGSPISVQTL